MAAFSMTGLATTLGSPTRAAGAASDEALVDCLRERGTEDVAADLDAAAAELPASRESVDPLGDIVTVEPGERDCAEPGLDVGDRPRVLLPCFFGDVGSSGDVAPQEPTDRALLRRMTVVLHVPCGRLRGTLRVVAAELSRSVLAGRGVDAVDSHDPAVALLANGRLSRRLPSHESPPRVTPAPQSDTAV
jgi:hypothetical protein